MILSSTALAWWLLAGAAVSAVLVILLTSDGEGDIEDEDPTLDVQGPDDR